MEYREDELTEGIIRCVIKVQQTLGPGFLENIYRNSLLREIKKQSFTTEKERELIVYYDGEEVGRHRVDILVEGKIVVELKAS